jgi:hypothetical protein
MSAARYGRKRRRRIRPAVRPQTPAGTSSSRGRWRADGASRCSDGPPLAQPFSRAPYVVNTTEVVLFPHNHRTQRRTNDRRAVARERYGLFRWGASAAARVRRPSIQNIRERYSDHSPRARIPGRLTSSRLVSSARTAAFCQPDPHWPSSVARLLHTAGFRQHRSHIPYLRTIQRPHPSC